MAELCSPSSASDEVFQPRVCRSLPVSTVVRMPVLQAIDPVDDLMSALDQRESDLMAVRRKALSA